MSGYALALPIGSRIEGLIVERVLGQGAFGITYLVRDEALGTRFALKEYLPRNLSTRDQDGRIRPLAPADEAAYTSGLDKFIDEGRLVASLTHPNIVAVLRLFRANNSAYLQMPYYQGKPLSELLAEGDTFSEAEVNALLAPLLEALEYIHSRSLIHRDIKPSNIYLTREGAPILIDFGAARVSKTDQTEAYTAMGSDGYAALEQTSSRGRLGPWTDIYGFSATIYRLVTGQVPPPAPDRADETYHGEQDPLTGLSPSRPRGYTESFCRAIDAGLALRAQQRPQSVAEWRSWFQGERTVAGESPEHADDGAPRPERGPVVLYAFLLLVVVALVGTAAVFLVTGGPGRGKDLPVADSTVESDAGTGQKRAGTAEDEAAWVRAFSADTPQSYRAYLDGFPQGASAALATEQLAEFERMRWEQLAGAESVEAYEEYLRLFPDSENAPVAMGRLDALRAAVEEQREREASRQRADTAAWEKARNTGTKAALNDYLAGYPAGDHAAEARAGLQRIQSRAADRRAFEAAVSAGTKTSYQQYLSAFPSGAHAADAMQGLDDLSFKPAKLFSDCSACPEMVVLAPGTFTQGASESEEFAQPTERPDRLVRIPDMFAIGVYEVTFAQWDACAADGGCPHIEADPGWRRDDHPVINVTWEEASQFTAWLSKHTSEAYRLPSESEWEYAARGGNGRTWIGGTASALCAFANGAGQEAGVKWAHQFCADRNQVGPAKVGSYRQNEFGLFDVIGNVSEWTQDCASLSYVDAPTDGSAWQRGLCSSRIVRGGGWFHGAPDLRFAARGRLSMRESNDFTGFRVVREIQE